MNDIAAFTSTSASRGLFRRVLPAGLAVLVSLFAGPLRAVEAEIRLRLDYASIVRLPERTASIVIGNPVILDATLQRGGTAVLTGHGYGTTNIIFQDGGGAILEERTVLIVPPTQNLITVQRGNERETYACVPTCSPAFSLGDSEPFFETAAKQADARKAALK